MTEDNDTQQPVEADTSCEGKLAKCEQVRDEYLAGWQRAKADYQNLQKDYSERVKEEFTAGQWSILKELLPIMDQLEMALGSIPEGLIENPWVKGVISIRQNLERILKWYEVEPIKALNALFDPLYHESLEAVTSEKPEGTIVEEVQKGYMYKGRVLRPARVKIAKSEARNPKSETNSNIPDPDD